MSVTIAGVNVKGDTNKLGKYFNIKDVFRIRAEENIVNIGPYAARRGAAKTANDGVKTLCADVLGRILEK